MIVVAVVLCTAGVTAAAWGVVSDGDNGAPTARGAQAPIGTLSANNVLPEDGAGEPREPPTLGDRSVGGNGEGAGSSPGTQTAPVGGSGGGGNLPFTGFLAIPLLVLGSALLLGGAVLRRRTARAAV